MEGLTEQQAAGPPAWHLHGGEKCKQVQIRRGVTRTRSATSGLPWVTLTATLVLQAVQCLPSPRQARAAQRRPGPGLAACSLAPVSRLIFLGLAPSLAPSRSSDPQAQPGPGAALASPPPDTRSPSAFSGLCPITILSASLPCPPSEHSKPPALPSSPHLTFSHFKCYLTVYLLPLCLH